MNIDLTMDVTNKSKVIQSLLDNEIDFALVSILPDDIQVEKFNLIPNELYLVGNKEVGPDIKIEEQLASTPFIFREKGSGTRQVMEKFIAKNKIKIKIINKQIDLKEEPEDFNIKTTFNYLQVGLGYKF